MTMISEIVAFVPAGIGIYIGWRIAAVVMGVVGALAGATLSAQR